MISEKPDYEAQALGAILNSAFFKRSRVADDFHIKIKDMDYWRWVVKTYDEFLQSAEKKEIVPKKIHQIWVGSKIPKKYDRWRESWQRMNPDYEYMLWDEKEILELGLVNEKQFLQTGNPAVKSDLARYEVLNKFGGVYADTDFEALKPLSKNFLTRSFIVGQTFGYAPHQNNGLIIATPGAGILKVLIESLPQYPGPMPPMDVLKYCGPLYLSEQIRKHREKIEDIVILPSQYFYPWPNFMIHSRRDRYAFATDETVAIHHWEMSWMRRPSWSKALRKLLDKVVPY